MPFVYEKAQILFQRNETLLHSLNNALKQVDDQLNRVDRLSLDANNILQHEQWHPSLSSNPLWNGLRENLSEFRLLRAELVRKRAHLADQIVMLERRQEKLQQQSVRLYKIQQKLGLVQIREEK